MTSPRKQTSILKMASSSRYGAGNGVTAPCLQEVTEEISDVVSSVMIEENKLQQSKDEGTVTTGRF